jgi:hypothetical protein
MKPVQTLAQPDEDYRRPTDRLDDLISLPRDSYIDDCMVRYSRK